MLSPSALDTVTRVAPLPVRLPFLYRLLREPVRRMLERGFGLAIEGAEHLPAEGPYLVAANHHNYLDGVLLAVAIAPPIPPCCARPEFRDRPWKAISSPTPTTS